jgi:predicted MPP superfamily phosphohydrolase
MNDTIKFTVMGDMHYVQPICHQNTLNGNPSGITELADTVRNYWMTQNTLPDVISQIKALSPDFVIQTGDLVQGHCDSQEANTLEMRQAHDLISKTGSKVYYAMGTHDGVPGAKNSSHIYDLVYPAIGRVLGYSVSDGYYKFTSGNSLFIVLDYTTYTRNSNQYDFLRDALLEGENHQHVFIFAHPPIVPVARPFFTDYKFASDIRELFKKYHADAYFCGHTHNQIASLHLFEDNWIPQLKSSVLGYPDILPVEADNMRVLLPDPAVSEIGWAYMEDSAPGWWFVTVNSKHVQADWHVLHKGVIGIISWNSGEKPVFVKKPPAAERAKTLLSASEIKNIRLRAAGSGFSEPDNLQIFINGKPVGRLPSLEYFDCRQYLEISPSFRDELSDVNTVKFTMPSVPCCIGGFVIEIESDNGLIRSEPSSFYVNTSKWDQWNERTIKYAAAGEDIIFNLRFV